MGVDLDLAGIYAEVKSLSVEKTVSAAVHKNTQKKKTNAFGFCIIQSFQSYYLYLAIDVFTEMCRIQKDGKVSHETYSFVWECDRDQAEDVRGTIIVSRLSKKMYLRISTFVDLIIGST